MKTLKMFIILFAFSSLAYSGELVCKDVELKSGVFKLCDDNNFYRPVASTSSTYMDKEGSGAFYQYTGSVKENGFGQGSRSNGGSSASSVISQ